jgi:flagellum-specific ATP synthase
LMPLGPMEGISEGAVVRGSGGPFCIKVSEALQGRVLNGTGEPADGEAVPGAETRPVLAMPPHPLERTILNTPLCLGVRAIDALLTCAKGQRIGIFSGSGVGKSTLLGMIARHTEADVNVIALVGERGREVREFIENDLGKEGMARSVVVVATSDQPSLVRVKAPLVATAVAEYFRDRGKDVLLMMDSLTRLAMAQREVGLSVGEPPSTRGYTPSVFALMPRLLERAGSSPRGTITGIYTVLVEGDDTNEPISDHARAILDGHIVLSRALAHQGHYPAIDISQSISRIMPAVSSAEHQEGARAFRELLAAYEGAADLIQIGAYEAGSSPLVDRAIERREPMMAFLRQSRDEALPLAEAVERMREAAGA